jgi:hypothetical protein
MGFKGLKAFNMAMFGKQAWKLISSPESLITRLLKAKYFSRSDYFGVSIGHNPSYVWRSIWSAKDVIRRGFQWSIGTGEHIPVWYHPWLSNAARILPSTHHHLEGPSIRVSDLLVTPQKQWNMELINDFFDNATVRNIFNTPLFPSVTHDVLVWKFERDDAYSVKSAYKDILNHDVAVVHHRVPGIWNCIWSLKLPLKVKNFLWRACRNCLPTRI